MARRAPVGAQHAIDTIQQFAEARLSPSMGHTVRGCLVGMVVGAWINAHARFGSFDMSVRDLEYVQKLYENCCRVAGQNSLMGLHIMAELFEHQMMPELMFNPFNAEPPATEARPSGRPTSVPDSEDLDRRRRDLDRRIAEFKKR